MLKAVTVITVREMETPKDTTPGTIHLDISDCRFDTPALPPATPAPPVDKVSFQHVSTLIQRIYTDPTMIRSTALDILAIYLKGQKIIYTEAKTFCEMRLNTLMMPAIMTTAVCTVLSMVLKDWEWGPTVVASLNAFNSFLLALVSYLKLDAKAEAHKTSAYKYDKLQAYCEFKSGQILFFKDHIQATAMIDEIIKHVETQITEIKETNQFLIPESIRYALSRLYGTNVFALVKNVQHEEMIRINQLKSIINELLERLADPATPTHEKIELEKKQDAKIQEIIGMRDYYLKIDRDFSEEIRARARRLRLNLFCST
jgi:hypothetical protein